MARRQSGNDGLGIGQLGDDVGAYERGDLDSFYTHGHEPAQDVQLHAGGIDLRQALQAVAEGNVHDLDLLGELHLPGSITTNDPEPGGRVAVPQSSASAGVALDGLFAPA